MGSLGDKFKKLAGDQTRQLLQNFQNAQSSKTRNGYSYGKLNEDGTATLADGTVVQTVVKGRPGQYAPVFNLGNGQGLVDQPEAKFFTVDGGEILRYKIAAAEFTQIRPASSATIYSNANIVETSSIELHDYILETTNLLRPELYSTLGTLPAPDISTGPGFITVLGGTITGTPFTSGANHTYAGVYVLLGAECKDLLLYQRSSYSASDIYTSYSIDFDSETGNYTLTDAFVSNVDVGSSHYFKYVLLKDFYVDSEGFITSDSQRFGTFTGPLPSEGTTVTNFRSGGVLGGYTPSRVVTETQSCFIPFLCRDINGNPTISIYGVKATSNNQYSATLTVVEISPGPPPAYGLTQFYTQNWQTSLVVFYTSAVGTDSENTSILPVDTYEQSAFTSVISNLGISGGLTQLGLIGGGSQGFLSNDILRLNPLTILPLGSYIGSIIRPFTYYFVGPDSIVTEAQLTTELGIAPVPAYDTVLGGITSISVEFGSAPNAYFSYIIPPNSKNYWVTRYRPNPNNNNIYGFYKFRLDADSNLQYRQLPTTVDLSTYTIPQLFGGFLRIYSYCASIL